MARVALGVVLGLTVGVVFAAALSIHAAGTEPDEETLAVAQEAGVSPLDLLGAVNTTGLQPRAYLIVVGELTPLPPPPAVPAFSACSWPICGALGQRIYCVEGIESRHGAAMYNPQPWGVYAEHAQGWLGWLPSTAGSVGVTIGSRVSEWAGAAKMIALGRGREFFGIAAGIC